jgi:hypothetical protein
MLKIWDTIFLWLHIVIILFNLFGWIWNRTRKLHLIVVFATIFSWLVLGIKYGLGYCFLTDWHWEIKRKIGESELPASFIKYFLDRFTPFQFTAHTVDLLTGIIFSAVAIITIYINFIHSRIFRQHQKT